MLPDHLDAKIQIGSWPVPPLWDLIKQKGNIPAEEMYRVFNMGIGMVIIADKIKAAEIQEWIPERTFVIGELVEGNKKVQFVN